MQLLQKPFMTSRLLGLLLVLLLGSKVFAQPAPAAFTPGPTSRAITYIIALTDRLRVDIFQENDLGVISRVDSKGRVNLQLVGPVQVAGMTIEEAEVQPPERVSRAFAQSEPVQIR